ncbi:hypothetical protein D3C74_43370 [compost metagenome]
MPVQINITGTDAAESLRELSALSAGLFGNSATPVQEEKPKRNTRSTKTDTKPETTKPEPVQEDAEQQEDTSSDDGEDIPDDVALRAAATEKAKAVGKAKIKALLDKYEVANVTAIPDDQRVAFMQELSVLGDLA